MFKVCIKTAELVRRRFCREPQVCNLPRFPLGTDPLYRKLCGEKSVISAWRGRGGIWTVLVPAVLYLALEEQDS